VSLSPQERDELRAAPLGVEAARQVLVGRFLVGR
jgi:hypothetical protein